MMQDIFAERLVNLQIHQGIARLDFARLETIDVEKNQATFAPAFRLAMPVDAFMQMAEQFQKVRETIQNQAKDRASAPAAA
ncbi:MAG: hypothetical protein Q8S20_02235 [Sulfuritalea sp.]|nr:hypothetical protein [Sulfuritalea sp.]